MKTYTIKRVSAPVDWSAVPTLHVDEHLWLPSPDIHMDAQICYDETALYVHMRAVEPHIRAEYTGPLSMVCEDSCMEIFFCPRESDERYLNIEMNPNGCTFLGISHCRADNVRLAPMNEEELFQKRVNRLEDGWEIFYQIPVSFINVFFDGYKLEFGMVIRANVYKCGDLTVTPHYLSWNPVVNPTPDYHRSCDFGTMVLE